MFKLGAFTDEISQDLERACRVCNEFGLEGVEIRGVWDTPCQNLSPGQVQDIKRIVAGHGLVVCSVASPFGKCELDNRGEVVQHMDILRRCSDIALELDCRVVRGFAFWGPPWPGVSNAGSEAATTRRWKYRATKPWDKMLDAYGPVPGILDDKGIILGLENEAACLVGTAGHLRHFLDLLGCDNVKALWDPANHVQDVEGPDMPAFPEGYDCIKNDLVHVHVKDAAPAPDGTVPNVFMGQGIVGWERQFQALKDDGFNGFCSLETHVNPDKFPEAMTAKYGHLLTGERREGASRVCLAWIREVVDNLR